MAAKLQEGDADDLEYQFKVVYTLTSASKARAHFQFVQPESAEGKEIQNVLIKYKSLDDIYPLKPSDVIKLITVKIGRDFTFDMHQRAWKMFKARPKTGVGDPAATDKRYCAYHAPYKSYTYSQAWVDFLADRVVDDQDWLNLKSFKG